MKTTSNGWVLLENKHVRLFLRVIALSLLPGKQIHARFRQYFLFFIVYNNIKLITNIYILFANPKTRSIFCTGGAAAQNSPRNTQIILKCPYISVFEPSCKGVQKFFFAEFPGLTNQGPVRDSNPGAPLRFYLSSSSTRIMCLCCNSYCCWI